MFRNPERRSYAPVSLLRVAAVASFAVLSACGADKTSAPADIIVHSAYKDWDANCIGTRPYRVQKGDTVYSILDNNTTLIGNNRSWEDMPPQTAFDAVRVLNGSSMPNINTIIPGDRIQIPKVCEPKPQG